MDLKSIKTGLWNYRKGTVQLVNNQSVLLTIIFGGRISQVFIDNRRLEIKKTGFWRPQITIMENETVLLTQTPIGICGYSYEVRIGGRLYSGKGRANLHYHLTYHNAQGIEVASFHMNAWKWKPTVQVNIIESAAPADDALLLLIVGYYTLRKVKQDSDGAVVAIAAAG